MTLKEFFKEIENQAIDTYIVTLKYKYEFEDNYTIENQILEYVSVGDEYVWQNDWYEGQTDVEVLGYMLLGDVDTTKLKPCEDCISREAVVKLLEAGDWADTVIGVLKLPSVEPKPIFYPLCEDCNTKMDEVRKAYDRCRWIPVSERLPKEAGVYLVSMNRLGYPQREVDGFVCGRWERFGNDVIAWCEIPQPYKAEGEE